MRETMETALTNMFEKGAADAVFPYQVIRAIARGLEEMTRVVGENAGRIVSSALGEFSDAELKKLAVEYFPSAKD